MSINFHDNMETLISAKLVKIFPAFYGTRWFTTMYTTGRQWTLPRITRIQSTHSHFSPFKSSIMLSFYQLDRWALPFRLCDQNFVNSNSMLKGHSLLAAQTTYPKLSSIFEGRLFQTQLCNGDNSLNMDSYF